MLVILTYIFLLLAACLTFGRVWSIISLWVPAQPQIVVCLCDCLGYSAAVSVLEYTSISDTCNNSYVCVCVPSGGRVTARDTNVQLREGSLLVSSMGRSSVRCAGGGSGARESTCADQETEYGRQCLS